MLSLLGGLLGATPAIVTPASDYSRPMQTGTMPVVIRESSGLAVSRRDPNILWTHNDSGGQSVLYAVDQYGRLLGTLRVNGIKNRDWEDLASFELDGRAWLLIAETGDNAGNRQNCALYIVPEPDPATLSADTELTVDVAWQIPVRYADGPRDCEAVAVDAQAGLVYLLAKRTRPHGLYTLPLRAPADGVVREAVAVAQFPNKFIPQPDENQAMLPIATGRYRAQPTGMDFSADRSTAVIVSYGDVLIFPRQGNEDWAAALLRPPVILAQHELVQAEGVAFAPDGRTIYVSSEDDDAPILRYAPAVSLP